MGHTSGRSAKGRRGRVAAHRRRTTRRAAGRSAQASRAHRRTTRAAAAKPEKLVNLRHLALLRDFDAAVRQFQRGHYERAQALFEELATNPAREIADRARMYIRWCAQKASVRKAAPKTAEEFYVAGVAALNARDSAHAIESLTKAAKMERSSEHILYALAAAHAVAGDAEGAIERLKTSIRLRPSNWGQARRDDDFQSLVHDQRFLSLDPSTSSAAR